VHPLQSDWWRIPEFTQCSWCKQHEIENSQFALEWSSRTQKFQVGRKPIPSTGCGIVAKKRQSISAVYLLTLMAVTVSDLNGMVSQAIWPFCVVLLLSLPMWSIVYCSGKRTSLSVFYTHLCYILNLLAIAAHPRRLLTDVCVLYKTFWS